MNTETRPDTLPEDTGKTESDETPDLDALDLNVDMPGPSQEAQVRTLVNAAVCGTPFCEKCQNT